MSSPFLLKQGPKQVAKSKNAMVSSSHPAVTKAMIDVMRDGGNAVDAAITGSLIQPIYEPHRTNHAGTITFLHWNAEKERAFFMDAAAELPEGIRPYSPNPHMLRNAACIPGFIPGLQSMAERFGTKKWSYYVQPSIKAAEDGPIVDAWEYAILYSRLKRNTYFPSGRDFFTPDGFLITAGEKWKRPKLAETLTCLAEEGPEYFMKGDWARHLIHEGNKIGWELTEEHMASYQPIWLDPLRFKYRDNEIIGIPPPQRGGLYTGLILGVLEEFNLNSMGHYTESAETLALMAWVLNRVHKERNMIHDPTFYDVPVDVLLSKEYHRIIARLWCGSRPKIDMTTFLRLNKGVSSFEAVASSLSRKVSDSCELSIVDTQGNWVEMMNTGNGGGIPGMVIDGVPNNGTSIRTSANPFESERTGSGRFGEIVEPGARTRHAIANTLVLQNGIPWLAMGSPGDCIFTVPQTLLNIIEFGMDPYSAIDAPRFWPLSDDGTLEIETRIPNKVIAGLVSLGIMIKPLGTYNSAMGSMQIVWRDNESGLLGGVADPRRLGKAEGF